MKAPNDTERKSCLTTPSLEEEMVAVKLVPIEGSVKFNGEAQKSYDEVLSEVIIAKWVIRRSITQLSKIEFPFQERIDGDLSRCSTSYALWLITESDPLGSYVVLRNPPVPRS